jgi:AraC family transcriptional regulator
MSLGPDAEPGFPVQETQGREYRTGNRMIATSDGLGWRSVYATIFEQHQTCGTAQPVHHPNLIYLLGRPIIVTRKISGNPREKGLILTRQFTLTPGGVAVRWEDSRPPEILQVFLRHSIYAAAVRELCGCDVTEAEIVSRFTFQDPLLEQLALAIASKLRDGSAQDTLYIDTIAQMIAMHLARYYSSRSRPAQKLKTMAIPSWKIRRLIEFIEEHLDGDLSLESIGAEVEISALYLPRVFKASVGQSPHQYVLERRIERAKDLLRNTDLPIMNVALAAGFSSQGHLSNWFVRRVGLSPAVYRRQGLQ